APAMLMSHDGAARVIHPTAFVAPNAMVCGNVTVGPGCRILHGAQLVAEGSSISLGRDCIVMENAVLRSSVRHPLYIGDHCLVGPNAHVVGCTVETRSSSPPAPPCSMPHTSAAAARCACTPWSTCARGSRRVPPC